MSNLTALSGYGASASPNYSGLVKFLITPFLESPESISVDCEQCRHNRRVWVRLAFEADDKGKVYGRGGRNIQAIRTVLETAATTAGQSLYLEIYEGEGESESQPRPKRRISSIDEERISRRKPRSQRPITPRFNQFPE